MREQRLRPKARGLSTASVVRRKRRSPPCTHQGETEQNQSPYEAAQSRPICKSSRVSSPPPSELATYFAQCFPQP